MKQCTTEGCDSTDHYAKGLCAKCYRKQHNREYYQANRARLDSESRAKRDPEREQEYQREYYRRNAERRKEASRRHYAENRERIRAQDKADYAANPEKYKVRAQRWNEENPERKKERGREYRKENLERLRAYDRSPARKLAFNERRRRNYRETRRAALLAYGDGSCAACGSRPDDVLDLELDHVNDDGAEHRERLTGSRRGGIFEALREAGWPTDVPLQTLCPNCHVAKHPPKNSQNLRLKLEALEAYGDGSCAHCCWRPPDLWVLELDHTNGDGKQHRQDLGTGRGGKAFLLELRRRDWSTDVPLQTLCPNCHREKSKQESAARQCQAEELLRQRA